MKTFFFLLVLLISAPLNAEPGTDATDSEDDLALRTRDTNDVVRMRKFLESKYLGNIHLGPGQNEPMREYINWLMEPLESLVFKKQLMTRLRLKQLGGPTGVAKTQVARDFMEMAKKFKLILPNRADYRQGDANTKIDLAIVEKLQIAEKDLQSAGNTNGYGNVKARHLQTYALLFLDEFSHNAVPAKDLTELTENFGTQLRALKEQFDRKRTAINAQTPVPTKPVETKNEDPKAYEARLSQYQLDLIEHEIKNALSPSASTETFEDAVHQLKLRYNKDRSARATLDAVMHKIWQATSSGYWSESEEKGRIEDLAKEINAAHLKIIQFSATRKQHPILKTFDQVYREIAPLKHEIAVEANAVAEMGPKLATVQRRWAALEHIPPYAIDAWLAANDLTAKAGGLSEAGGLPEFLDRMTEEIRRDPEIMRPDQLGFTPTTKQKPPSALALKLRAHVTKTLENEMLQLETDKDRKVNQIRRLREEVERRRDSVIALGHTQKEQGNPDKDRLVADYERLQETYHEAIMNAKDLPASRDAIDDFFIKLTPGELKSRFRNYHNRLISLGQDPTQYLRWLRESKDNNIKLTEIIRMDTDVARELIKTAVNEVGFRARSYYLGNINVIMSFNDIEVENRVNAHVERIRNEYRRGPTLDEFAAIYRKEVPHDWSERFMKLYFNNLFAKIMAGKLGNPIAEKRRTQGGEGATFIYPMDATQMVTSVATTLYHEFEHWKDTMRGKGLDVDGVNLYLHENVAPQFVRDDVHVEFGPNAVLTPVRQSIGKLLTVLTDQVLKRHAADPGEYIRMNLALIDEANRGPLHNLTLRYLDPAFEQISPVLTKVPTLGKNSLVAAVSHIANPSQSIVKGAYNLVPVVITVDPKKPLPLTVAEQEAEDKRVQDLAAETEATRVANEVKEIAIAAENAKEVATAAAKEADKKRHLDKARANRKLENLIKSKPSRSQIAEHYHEIEDPEEQARQREYLFSLAKARRSGANMGYLYMWLDIEFENGANVDNFIGANFTTIKKQGGISTASMLPDVVTDESLREHVRSLVSPGFFSRLFRKTACGLGFGPLVHRQVPQELRAGIPRHRLFGGEK